MNTINKCKNCAHFHLGEMDQNLQRQNVCKRYPPIPYPVPTGQGIGTLIMYPIVADNDFCGEFCAKLVDIPH